jgi:hypothetical protein
MRIPNEARQPLLTTTTTLGTEYSDHKALLVEISQIGDPTPHILKVDTYPTTRDLPPFNLPIPKPLIDLYQLRNDTTPIAQQEALLTIRELLNSD